MYNAINESAIISCKNYGEIVASGGESGGIIGFFYGASKTTCEKFSIINCYNEGKINPVSSYGTGGICGRIWSVQTSIIKDCDNIGEVEYSDSTGGILGRINDSGTVNIVNSNNKGKITGYNNTGGILGAVANCEKTDIRKCSNTAGITGKNSFGGILGYQAGNSSDYIYIENSYNTGDMINLITSGCIGGIVGRSDGAELIINLCYNRGARNTGTDKDYCMVGGIIGEVDTNSAIIAYSYNVAKIAGEYAGGIIGRSQTGAHVVYKCYNSGEIVGRNNIGGIVGRIDKGNIESCYNFGKISAAFYDTYQYVYVGGIVGYVSNSGNIKNCSNFADLENNLNLSDVKFGGIAGYVSGGETLNCNNTGNITNTGNASNIGLGGIVAYASSNLNILNSYNTGNISNTGSGSSIYLGGICSNSSYISNSYNTGEIKNYVTGAVWIYVGGIVGYGSASDCYNTGEIMNLGAENSGASSLYVAGIVGYVSGEVPNNNYNIGSIYNSINGNSKYVAPVYGYMSSTSDENMNYYLQDIEVKTRSGNQNYATPLTEEYMKSKEFYDLLSESGDKWIYIENNYPMLDINVINDATQGAKLVVNNKKQTFDITTEMLSAQSSGTTSGEYSGKYTQGSNKKLVQTLDYAETSTEQIEIKPSEGYVIQSILINDEYIEYEVDEQGNYTIPAGYFKEVVSNYNIKVSFAENEKALTINKVDDNNNKLKGAKFKIASSDLTKFKITPNSVPQVTFEEPIPNDTNYYFTRNEDGTALTVNNIGTYGTTAKSYYKIDLTDIPEDEESIVIVNTNISGYGYLYADITEDDTALVMNPNGKFIFVQNNTAGAQDFCSSPLKGGKEYYLHLTFYNTSPLTTTEVNINSIKVLSSKTELNIDSSLEGNEEYHFTTQTNTNGAKEYIPNNLETAGTTANSYIPIDLTKDENKENKYIVKVDTISENTGMLFGKITQDTQPITYDVYTCFLQNSNAGEKSYCSQVLDGGEEYYLQLGFQSASEQDTSTVKITKISLINIYENEEEAYVIRETNANGQIIEQVPAGKYTITETEPPEGYEGDEQPIKYTVKYGQDNEITVSNSKLQEVVVHYYLQNTGEEYGTEAVQIKEDKHIYDVLGENYNTSSNIEPQIDNYYLLQDDDGEYIIPENAIGTFANDVIDVYYYYNYQNKETKTKDIPVKKQWKIPKALLDDYKAIVRLLAITHENGYEIIAPVTDENGEVITKEIRGNDTEMFEDLKIYNGEEKIEYVVEEIMVKKLKSINNESTEEEWEEVPLNQFKVTYK